MDLLERRLALDLLELRLANSSSTSLPLANVRQNRGSPWRIN